MTKGILLYIFLIISALQLHAQTYDKNIAEFIKRVENPYTFLYKIEQIGVKMSGTPGLDSAFFWLNKISTETGYYPIIHKFNNTTDTLINIELVKKGENDSSILVCAHYDSWVGKGVNDNGTGDFAVYQMAKLFKNLKSKYTIRFIFFSGEEIGYKGSYNYVSKIKENKIKVKYMLNFDQLGGTIGEDNSRIKCEKDEQTSKSYASEILTNKIASCYSLYTSLNPQLSKAILSDYIPFMDSGYVISGVYQYSTYPYYHTSEDLLKYIELTSLIETTKGALASLIYLSEEEDSSLLSAKTIPNNGINVYFTNNVLIFENLKGYNFKIYDNKGVSIFENKVGENYAEYSIDNISVGIYNIIFQNNMNCISKKIFLQWR